MPSIAEQKRSLAAECFSESSPHQLKQQHGIQPDFHRFLPQFAGFLSVESHTVFV
jgi:hypothetical protein